jgi:4-amino-4-deoxy-L-arabinose transferase-like glycosyltransferase
MVIVTAEREPWRRVLARSTVLALAACIVSSQLYLGLLGADDAFTRGHNGFNSAAYLLAARNSLRWQQPFPHQYHTAPRPPAPEAAYTHAPLGVHLHNVAAVHLLGDRPLSVRGVAALHGVLVVLALLVVVSAHWSRAHGLLAAGIYTVLPINAIYVNMVNHTAGFLFWSILMLHCYLRFRERQQARWFAGVLATSWLATSWDWPAYYVAFCVALHWLSSWLLARRHAESNPSLAPFLLPFSVFCVWILLTIAGFVAAIHFAAGGTGDLLRTLADRQHAEIDFWMSARVVPRLLFTWPVLLVCAGWLLELGLRIRRGSALARDLLPLSFALAGTLHYCVFRNSATVHEYWLWPALPFVAIAMADFVVRGCAFGATILRHRAPTLRRPLQTLTVGLVLMPLLALLVRSAELVPAARQVGGSLWFLENVRGTPPAAFDSGRAELRFASMVRTWTDRTTGVLLHEGLDMFKLEPRFEATLDREVRRVSQGPLSAPVAEGVHGWVFIGTTATLSIEAVLELADAYALTIYDHYFVIDLRRRDHSTRVYRLARADPSLRYRLLHSPFEPAARVLRDLAAEQALARRRAPQKSSAVSRPPGLRGT